MFSVYFVLLPTIYYKEGKPNVNKKIKLQRKKKLKT